MNGIEEAINNRSQNVAKNMGEFTVDEQVYSGYTDYSFIWEKSYVKSPSRSMNGSMGNLETFSTFITPHMTVTFEQMPISDFRRLVKQALSKNEFLVTCYDTIYNQTTTNKMYFGTLQSPKYNTRVENDGTVSIVSVFNYTVELIGTNNE